MADSGAATGGTPGAGGTPSQPTTDKTTAPGNAGGAQTGAQPQGGKPSEGQQAGQPDEGQDNYSELREALSKERANSKELAKRLKVIEEKDLPEAERTAKAQAETKAENESLRRELGQLRAQQAVFAEASKLGFADPMDAYRLIDIDLDDDGKPKAVTAQLTKLLESKPYLKSGQARATSGGSADAGNANGQPSGGNSMNDLIRQAAGRG